jgi:hypothetical protein
MFSEQDVRRNLSWRVLRPGEEAWREIRPRLEAPPRARATPSLAKVAVLVVLLAAVFWRWKAAPSASIGKTPAEFRVSRVASRGRPATALILRPDRKTLMVIVPD